jgi:3-oxoacyl-(acyl-carrier-protein) reductase
MIPSANAFEAKTRWSEGLVQGVTGIPSGRLSGRRALVTGASRGIGRAIALCLAEAGADVAVNYRSSEENAELLARRIDDIGVRTWIYPADVSDGEQTRAMQRQISRYFGRIDVLVNNAGINIDRFFSKMDGSSWEKVMDVNLNGVYNCTTAFLDDVLHSSHGRIINITSIVGQMGNIGQVNYAASKAGVIGMTKALARELARSNVTVNAVAPGFIETDMVAGMPKEVRDKVIAQIPLKRLGRPEEVAKAVEFLASDDASYITGHVLSINGGLYI